MIERARDVSQPSRHIDGALHSLFEKSLSLSRENRHVRALCLSSHHAVNLIESSTGRIATDDKIETTHHAVEIYLTST